MKVALCLCGQVGGVDGQDGLGGWLHPGVGHQYLDNVLLQHYDTDVFVHSWEKTRSDNTKISDEIMEIYNPKKCETVEQIQFKTNWADYGIHQPSDLKGIPGYDLLLPSRGSYEAIFEEYDKEAFKTHSRWYSTKRTIELKKEFETENNFKYDFVFLSRFDAWYRTKLNLEELNPAYFYAGARTKGYEPQIDEMGGHLALEDIWFLAGSDNMDKFGQLYDNIYNYCVRPPMASREHVSKLVGEDKLRYLWWFWTDYGILRNGRP